MWILLYSQKITRIQRIKYIFQMSLRAVKILAGCLWPVLSLWVYRLMYKKSSVILFCNGSDLLYCTVICAVSASFTEVFEVAVVRGCCGTQLLTWLCWDDEWRDSFRCRTSSWDGAVWGRKKMCSRDCRLDRWRSTCRDPWLPLESSLAGMQTQQNSFKYHPWNGYWLDWSLECTSRKQKNNHTVFVWPEMNPIGTVNLNRKQSSRETIWNSIILSWILKLNLH